ncbi:SRPBCC family protein [Dactylosporangium sp. CA-092794]|uniref:SRPBCC family protein n=1 Tax=Dactylosporangium sp. CA-092794 TaxID=3239929 RepID=UPI003D93470A
MDTSTPDVVEYQRAVEAPAEVVFARLADVARWPQLLGGVVHAEYLRRAGAHERIAVWELAGKDEVRAWQAERTLDAERLLIAFTEQPAWLGGAAVRGEWAVRPQPDATAVVTLRLRYRAAERDDAADELARHSAEWLDAVQRAAERADLDEVTLDFEDPVFAGGAVPDAWKVLYEADKWPEKLDHVKRLEMTEDVPNIQFFDMDTLGKDGRTVTTRSVRVCLPQRLIVYKQITPPPLMEAHTGHWRFTPTPEGMILGARHTCVIRPDRLDVLGAGTTLEGARRYLRRFLSANSTTNLRLAKAFAEERAGA